MKNMDLERENTISAPTEVRAKMNELLHEIEGPLVRLKDMGVKTIDEQGLNILKEQIGKALPVLEPHDQDTYLRLYNSVEGLCTTSDLETIRNILEKWIQSTK